MDLEQAERYGLATFDITKVWPHKDFPLIPVGKMTLNKDPTNHFAEIEQAAFSPSNMVPDITSSPDPMLQACMFAYPDAQRYRLGAIYQHLPPNQPVAPVNTPYQRDGAATTTSSYGATPSYVRNRSTPHGIGIESASTAQAMRHNEWLRGSTALGLNEIPNTEDDYVQPRDSWRRVFYDVERRLWVSNVEGALGGVSKNLKRNVIEMFGRVDSEMGNMLAAEIKETARL